MAGLKICTRWRAISARRSLRINSSLLPENIGPTTTSIQPILPLTMSTVAPWESGAFRNLCHAPRHNQIFRAAANDRALLLRTCSDGCGPIHAFIIERGEGRNHGIANAHGAGKFIDGNGKFDAIIEHFAGKGFRNLDAARAAVMTTSSIGNIGPALEEDVTMPDLLRGRMPQHFLRRRAFLDNIKTALQAHEVLPGSPILSSKSHQCFRALTRATHQFFPR